MSEYWIKLYHEILDDPKMAFLPDNQWRLVIEIFLVAGKCNKDGIIPTSEKIAWMLRKDKKEIEENMKTLEELGIVQRVDYGYSVTNFQKRQAATTPKERKQHQRNRERNESYYGTEDVTNRSQECHETVRQNRTDTDQNKTEIAPNGAESEPEVIDERTQAYLDRIKQATERGIENHQKTQATKPELVKYLDYVHKNNKYCEEDAFWAYEFEVITRLPCISVSYWIKEAHEFLKIGVTAEMFRTVYAIHLEKKMSYKSPQSFMATAVQWIAERHVQALPDKYTRPAERRK